MSEYLSEFSNSLASVVENGDRYVVRVEARRRLAASGVVWSADGLVVTAHHVVQQDSNIRVGLPDGRRTAATLVGRDPTTDLALLRIEGDSQLPPPATRGDLNDLKVGHLALALGRPWKTVQATLGIVSAFGESWRTPVGGELDHYLQTDVVMYPGFSGGPLVDVAGNVLGINSSALLRGVSLTIPAPTIERVVSGLLADGRIRRGYLGVGVQPARLPDQVAEQLDQQTGLLITSVEPGTPAEEAGLLLGDTLVAVAGFPVRHMDDLQAVLAGDRVGATVSAKVLRGGQIEERSILIGERP